MPEVALLTVKNVGILLVYIAAGYLLCRSHKLPKDAPVALSSLCTMLLMPAYTVNNLAQHFTVDRIASNMLMLGYGTLFTVLIIGLGLVLARIFSRIPLSANL